MDLKAGNWRLLPPIGSYYESRRPVFHWQSCLRAAIVFAVFIYAALGSGCIRGIPLPTSVLTDLENSVQQCTQIPPLYPTKHRELAEKAKRIYTHDGFPAEAAELLGGAVRIETEVYDDYGRVGEDRRWDKFAELHDYLLRTFPAVHDTLNLTKVNTYALVYTWAGSSRALKPLMLTAHQDVVPVEPETLSQWIHPPFSGYYDGDWIWGRGTADVKSSVIAILTALETLITQGFRPTRSIIVAFGIDEEASGRQGGGAISKHLLTTYGPDPVALLVDEGDGLAEQGGTLFAAPCVGEKGYIDVQVEVTTPGGHSSVPPEHTAIGHLASLIQLLESNPFPLTLSRTNPYYDALHCLAEHSTMPPSLAEDIKKSIRDNDALKRVEKYVAATSAGKAALGTTQAVDMIRGGVKVNALPEQVHAIVNHRISVDSSVDEVKNRFCNLLHPYSQEFNLSFNAFGVNFTSSAATVGQIKLSDPFGSALEPAPVSPHARGDGPWELLAGTIRAQHENVVVSPTVIVGNTDTQFYWQLTRAIFRYDAIKQDDVFNDIHTVNEAIRATGLVDKIRFYTSIILNADEADL